MRRRVLGLLCLGVLMAAAVLPVAAAPKPFDQMAPENTTLFVSARNVSDFLKRFDASTLGEVWNGPDMKPFVSKMSEAFDVLFNEAGKSLGYSLKDYNDLLQGEAALILGDPASIEFKAKRSEIPLTLLIDVGARKEKAREFLAKNLELIEKQGKTKKREEEFRGTKLILLEDQAPKDGDLKALVIALADDLLAVSLSQTFLQDMLANRGDAAVKALSDHADYRMLRAQYGREADFFVYAHVGRWLDSLPKIVKATGGENAETELGTALQVLDMIGVAGLRSVVFSGTLGGDGITQTLFVHTAGAPKGLMKVITHAPQALRFPAIVPEDVHNCSVVLVDFEALWSVIENGVKMAQGMMAGGAAPGGVDPLQAFEEQLGISIKRDIFGSLGKQVVIYERLKKPYNIQSQATAILIELRDKAKFQAALEKLTALVPFLQKKEYLGRALYTMGGMPGMEDDADPNAPKPPMPAICITDTHFVFANQKELAEEAIRRIGKDVRSVSDTPAFKALEGKYPPAATLLSYGTAEGFEYLFFMAKQFAKGEIPGLPPGMLDLDNADPNEPGTKFLKLAQNAFGRLPDASVFTSRIAGGIGWGFADDKGIGVTSKFLFKATTK